MKFKCFMSGFGLVGLLLLIVSYNSFAKDEKENVSLSIPKGITAFEQSAFCKTYRCWLHTVEPLNFQGVVEYYFYNYIIIDKEQKSDISGKKILRPQVGIRMFVDNPYTPSPDMSYPTLIIRWFPVRNKQDIDLNVIEAICQSTMKRACPDVVAKGKQFIRHMHIKHHKEITLQKTELEYFDENFIANYSLTTGGNIKRYPQFTFMLNYISVSNDIRK